MSKEGNAISISELRTWHWLDVDFSISVDDLEARYRLITETCNYELFLRMQNTINVLFENQTRQWLMESEEDTVKYFVRNNIRTDEMDPRVLGRLAWQHEQAHKEAATAWGVRSANRISWVKDGDGYYPQPWNHWKVSDLAELADRKVLFGALYEILIAPSLIGVGYEAEETLAGLCLASARKFEGYQG